MELAARWFESRLLTEKGEPGRSLEADEGGSRPGGEFHDLLKRARLGNQCVGAWHDRKRLFRPEDG